MKNRIKQLRREHGLKQSELAEEFNNFIWQNRLKIKPINFSVISKWETEKSHPTKATYKALANLFDVSVPYLKGALAYDDLTPEEKKLEDRLGRTINDAINDELKYSELSSEENRRAIKLALQSALAYYA
ncbi:helix-turn-helix domain-containing protein [uncultured Lactobacillus sp.]|uniref:helix-turn-helix domain-containing protein n=1 Tax=uncultured Lactobacillus sp. TaxID=153152 RepID=UPI002583FCB3|nr:helix-turn-helix transcriptional regulator [uncultured Lactobacillus sp.]